MMTYEYMPYIDFVWTSHVMSFCQEYHSLHGDQWNKLQLWCKLPSSKASWVSDLNSIFTLYLQDTAISGLLASVCSHQVGGNAEHVHPSLYIVTLGLTKI